MSRIHSVRATAINVPMVAPYRYSFGSLASFTTTIVEVEDDDGVVGIGETPHGDLAEVVERLGQRLAGLGPDELNACEAACLDRTGYSPWTDSARDRRAFGGIEIALWDLRARREGRPLVDLMGGRVRDEVPFTEYFALRDGKEETPADVIAYCVGLAEQGVPWFEGKLGVLDERVELQMVADLVSQIGAERVVRLDANGAFTVATARRVCRRLAEIGIGWLEDPCRTLDETARLREDGVPVSFSTHEADLPRAARTGVPDAICADIAELGGIRRTQDFLRACDALGIEFWCYSGDAGVMTAAYLHLTGSERSIIRPHQSLFRFTADVVVEQGHYRPSAGVLPVPTEPGLGVTLDRDALSRLSERYRSEGAIASGRPDERMGAAYRRR
jgi:glucarate dehydratase